MHDRTCFFGCKRFFDCVEGKENEHVKCNRFSPVEGYEEEHKEPMKFDFDKMLGIHVEIDED